MEEVKEKVITIIDESLGLLKRPEIDQMLKEDLGADDIDIIELTMELEGEFDIDIPDVDMENFLTVQNVVDCVVKLAGA